MKKFAQRSLLSGEYVANLFGKTSSCKRKEKKFRFGPALKTKINDELNRYGNIL